ncbi:twin-arginine translocation signal domain-containing protein [Pelagibacterium xiamenense]|uniref:twin-arginine translocation signal domain-containing protein n=1 Tax=Pelagibacterium xiamenense TaxID=2901140 RepID=UPI001E3AED3C|nr:twin-arginine translocation signal domain-containing protein [Pelagibacterium xiamenense]MCD7061457.1 twin-arginine translocation signal domain-containing protein [Pelagibacterium xiamenense]
MTTRRDFLRLSSAALAAGTVLPAAGQTPPELNESIVDSRLRTLANSQLRRMSHAPIILDAVKLQNRVTGAYSRDLIDRLNGDWRREVYNMDRRTLIPAVLETPASYFLAKAKALSEGLYTEFLLLDARGLTVALSELSALYWHGDRPRWREPYEAGLHGLWVGPYELNQATGVWQRQVSITVSDPSSLYPLGVLCAGVAVEAL